MPVGLVRSGAATLRSARDFRRVLETGRAVSTAHLVVYVLRRDDDGPGRYGLVVSRQHGGAVERNQTKRRLRSAIDRAGGVPPGFDSVVRVRPGTEVDVSEVTGEFLQLWGEVEGA